MIDEISLERQNEFFGALTDPMPPEAIEWRVQTAGEKNKRVWAKVVPYADARWLMQRLDEVFGPMNWWDNYRAGPDGGVLCDLSVMVDGVVVTKQDVAGNTAVEGIKGGVTDAFKRACVKLNVGNIRALYGCGELFADVNEKGRYYQGRHHEGRYPAFKWDPPKGFRLPESTAYAPASPDEHEADGDEELSTESLEEGMLDLPEPASKKQVEQIQNLYMPLSAHLTEAQRDKCKQAMQGTAEEADATIKWLMTKVREVNGQFAEQEA